MDFFLPSGHKILIDKKDFIKLKDWHWSIHRSGMKVRGYKKGEGHKKYRWALHRIILDAPKGVEVDHINGNSLDNRRKNLRLCTRAENCQNRRGWGKYGKCISKSGNKFMVNIYKNNERKYLGSFTSIKEAQKARDKGLMQIHGEFARYK